MDNSKYSLQTQDIVPLEAPSWKGIEGRTGGHGWGAFGPGKDQEIVVSLNTNATPVLQIIGKDSKWIPKLHFGLENYVSSRYFTISFENQNPGFKGRITPKRQTIKPLKLTIFETLS